MRKLRISAILLTVLMVVLTGVLAWGLINREWVVDYVRGASYQPTSEMARIREDLKLTERGEFLFNATQPVLEEKTAFNNVCRSATDTEVAVLGCYTGGNIYIYNIVAEELNGIRELTTAHELLHAVWARMSEAEKAELVGALEEVYKANTEVLEKDLATYDATMRAEELYVRAGTEVANLPAKLEKHYAEIFEDQDLVVKFYDSYIAVFRAIEAEMDSLKNEMDGIATEIDAKTDEYERRAGQLEADVVSFNACARVEGCFKSEAEFYVRRADLVAEQDNLSVLYDEINNLVAEYNVRVEKYNANVTRHETLDRMMNSNTKVDEIE